MLTWAICYMLTRSAQAAAKSGAPYQAEGAGCVVIITAILDVVIILAILEAIVILTGHPV